MIEVILDLKIIEFIYISRLKWGSSTLVLTFNLKLVLSLKVALYNRLLANAIVLISVDL